MKIERKAVVPQVTYQFGEDEDDHGSIKVWEIMDGDSCDYLVRLESMDKARTIAHALNAALSPPEPDVILLELSLEEAAELVRNDISPERCAVMEEIRRLLQCK